MKVPILFLIFDRKDVSIEAFKIIREYRPTQLFIAADGPRSHKPGEDVRCNETRNAILDMIDWDCNVKTLFRDNNLGCADAVSSGIDWFFENVDYGAIIEDDVIVSQSFFKFCEILLLKYEDEDRIGMITGMSFAPTKNYIADEYGFSNNSILIWGWATWRRAWVKNMDMEMKLWPTIAISKLIKSFGVFGGIMYYYYWNSAYKLISANMPFNSWATRWAFNCFAQDRLCIVPKINLSKNIGCSGIGGTHYSKNDEDPYSGIEISDLQFPLKHPCEIGIDSQIQKFERKDFFRVRMFGLKKKIKNVLKIF